jgi:membrane protein DedA with SNARE-associated domain
VRHGVLLVVVSRFIPGIRSLILVAAGLARMPFRQVAWALGVAVMLWQSIVVIGGYLAGEHWLRIVSVWTKVGVALLLIAVLAGYLWWRSTRTAPPGGVDDSG